VDIAGSGDTIRIASGTYVEQVMVPKSLTFIGAGIDSTVIKAPDTKMFDAFGQTYIFELTGVIVDNVTRLTVSGPGPAGSGLLSCAPGSNPLSLDMGVVVGHGATLNMEEAAVREVRDVPDSGCQRGTAISIGRPAGFSTCVSVVCVGHAVLESVQVTHYQKNGVAVRDAGSTLDIQFSSITNNPSSVIASNGVEVLSGARGKVQNNFISGNECNEAPICGPNPQTNDQGSGVLVLGGASGTVVQSNKVTSNDIGIYTDDGIPVTDNNANANRYESIFVDLDATGATVRRNAANDGQYGIYVNGATGNTFEFDSAHRNSVYDMYTTSAANTFHQNSCDTAFPSRQTWDCTAPECQEGDGGGHFHGDKGDGDVNFDSDGCRDGDQDQVDSNNRGDGHDFHSTQINSIAVDSLTHTVTITGIGTSDGSPVAFTLVAVEGTLLTPASVSFIFSDGFTNAGSLLDGSVTLH
jgi:hypothetical protein